MEEWKKKWATSGNYEVFTVSHLNLIISNEAKIKSNTHNFLTEQMDDKYTYGEDAFHNNLLISFEDT